jgi:hypothetical protein
MNTKIRRMFHMVLAGVASLTLITAPVFAADRLDIRENGYRSDNSVSVDFDKVTHISQSNNAAVSTDIRIDSDTGNARAGYNTGGDTFIVTGGAHTRAQVHTMANANILGWGNEGDHHMNGMDWFMLHAMGKKLHTSMTGSQEVPGPGDPDGHGSAHVRVHPSNGHLCVKLEVHSIDTPTAAHIHKAPRGVAGPVVVPLQTPTNGESVSCMTIDENLARAIKDNPQEYYVNVHNNPYPAGAVRGQLSK